MSRRIFSDGNHPQPDLNTCGENSPLDASLNEDIANSNCPDPLSQPSLRDPNKLAFLSELPRKKTGIGADGNCDPMQTGSIVSDKRNSKLEKIDTVIHRYSKALRGCDEAMTDLFRNIIVLDEDGKAHPVPIVWATQEKAVAYILQENVRKDNNVVDRIKLPIMAINDTDVQLDLTRYTYHKAIDYFRYQRSDNKPYVTNQEKRHPRDTIFGKTRGLPINRSYSLVVWTMYMEDIDQIIEQIITKFSPVAYINIRGVHWESIVTLDSIANNVDFEPGDQNMRVIKYQFNMTAQTYIPQSIVRKKAVLKTMVDIHNDTEPEEIVETLSRLEEAIEEIEQNG